MNRKLLKHNKAVSTDGNQDKPDAKKRKIGKSDQQSISCDKLHKDIINLSFVKFCRKKLSKFYKDKRVCQPGKTLLEV